MTTETRLPFGLMLPADSGIPFLLRNWLPLAGLLLLFLATLPSLGRQVWSTEAGAHAPIVLATGLWLISQCKDRVAAAITEARSLPIIAGLLIAVPLYAFGRAYDFISLEAAAIYLAMLVVVYRLVGFGGLREMLFPLFYLGFLVPPPGWLIDQITAPLQTFVSWVSTTGLQAVGYPIMREGVTLYIAQYQLLVEEACSGMNSIIGLISVSLFYIYIIHRASWRYALLLTAFIVPIAVFANIIRIVVLVLITYYLGDGAAQGFLHMTAGIVLFAVAIVLVFGLDMLLQRVFRRQFQESRA